jgi:hypothetical protein
MNPEISESFLRIPISVNFSVCYCSEKKNNKTKGSVSNNIFVPLPTFAISISEGSCNMMNVALPGEDA